MGHCKWKIVVFLTGYNIKTMGMVKTNVLDDSPKGRAPRDGLDAKLSAETEENLRRFALKWAILVQDAASYEQPMRTVLEFLATFLPKDYFPGDARGQAAGERK
jgi:hypothetical protein